jgi:hypothetical protein
MIRYAQKLIIKEIDNLMPSRVPERNVAIPNRLID